MLVQVPYFSFWLVAVLVLVVLVSNIKKLWKRREKSRFKKNMMGLTHSKLFKPLTFRIYKAYLKFWHLKAFVIDQNAFTGNTSCKCHYHTIFLDDNGFVYQLSLFQAQIEDILKYDIPGIYQTKNLVCWNAANCTHSLQKPW